MALVKKACLRCVDIFLFEHSPEYCNQYSQDDNHEPLFDNYSPHLFEVNLCCMISYYHLYHKHLFHSLEHKISLIPIVPKLLRSICVPHI